MCRGWTMMCKSTCVALLCGVNCINDSTIQTGYRFYTCHWLIVLKVNNDGAQTDNRVAVSLRNLKLSVASIKSVSSLNCTVIISSDTFL